MSFADFLVGEDEPEPDHEADSLFSCHSQAVGTEGLVQERAAHTDCKDMVLIQRTGI